MGSTNIEKGKELSPHLPFAWWLPNISALPLFSKLFGEMESVFLVVLFWTGRGGGRERKGGKI